MVACWDFLRVGAMEIFSVGEKVKTSADDSVSEEVDEKVYTLELVSADLWDYYWGRWWVSTMVMSLDPVTVC